MITTGPEAGSKCVFPFTKNGKICPGPKCCNVDNDPNGSWCSTKVDANGEHIVGYFGYCDDPACLPHGTGKFHNNITII